MAFSPSPTLGYSLGLILIGGLLQVKRARFSALIPRDIFHAVNNLHAPDRRQVSG